MFDAGLAILLGEGLLNTLKAAVLAMVLSLVIGTLLAVDPDHRARAGTAGSVVGVIELLRGIPVVIAIFFAARVLPEVGVDLAAALVPRHRTDRVQLRGHRRDRPRRACRRCPRGQTRGGATPSA